MADAAVVAELKRAYTAIKKSFTAAGSSAEVDVSKPTLEQLVRLVADTGGDAFDVEQQLVPLQTRLAQCLEQRGDAGKLAISVPKADANSLLKLAAKVIGSLSSKPSSSGTSSAPVKADAIQSTGDAPANDKVPAEVNAEEDIGEDASAEQLRRKLCSMARLESTLHSRCGIAAQHAARNAAEERKCRHDASILCAEVVETQKELASKHERSLTEQISERKESDEAWGACESLEARLRETRESFADETSAWARKLAPLHSRMLQTSRDALQTEDDALSLWRKLPRYESNPRVAHQVFALVQEHLADIDVRQLLKSLYDLSDTMDNYESNVVYYSEAVFNYFDINRTGVLEGDQYTACVNALLVHIKGEGESETSISDDELRSFIIKTVDPSNAGRITKKGAIRFKPAVDQIEEDLTKDKENVEPDYMRGKEASASSTSVLATELQAAQDEAQSLRRGIDCLEGAAQDLRDSLRNAAPGIWKDRRWARAVPRLTAQLEKARSEIEKLNQHTDHLKDSTVSAERRASVKSLATSGIWRWIAELLEYREVLQEQLLDAEVSMEASLATGDSIDQDPEGSADLRELSDVNTDFILSEELQSEAMHLRARLSERECRFTHLATSLEDEKRCRLGAETRAHKHSVVLKHLEDLHETLSKACLDPNRFSHDLKAVEDIVAKEMLVEASPELNTDMNGIEIDIRTAVREAWNDCLEKDLKTKESEASARRNSFDASAVRDLSSANNAREKRKALEQHMQDISRQLAHRKLDVGEEVCENAPIMLPKLQVLGKSLSVASDGQEGADLDHLRKRLLIARARRRLVGMGIIEVEAKLSECHSKLAAKRLEQINIQGLERANALSNSIPDIGAVQQKYNALEEECRRLSTELRREEAAMKSQAERCSGVLSRKAQIEEKRNTLTKDKTQKEETLSELVSSAGSTAKLKAEVHEENSEITTLQSNLRIARSRSETDRKLADSDDKKLADRLAELQKKQKEEEKEVKMAGMKEKLLASRRAPELNNLENEVAKASKDATATHEAQEAQMDSCRRKREELLAELGARKEKLSQRRAGSSAELERLENNIQELQEQAKIVHKVLKEDKAARDAPAVAVEATPIETVAPIASPVEVDVSQPEAPEVASSMQDESASPKKRPRTPEEEVVVATLDDSTVNNSSEGPIVAAIEEPSQKMARVEEVAQSSACVDENLSIGLAEANQPTPEVNAAGAEHVDLETPRDTPATAAGSFEASTTGELGTVAATDEIVSSETAKVEHPDNTVEEGIVDRGDQIQ